jgi:hypothetical protein
MLRHTAVVVAIVAICGTLVETDHLRAAGAALVVVSVAICAAAYWPRSWSWS